MTGTSGVDETIFTEQAEYIPAGSLRKWVQAHPSERIILKKLASAGAKLVVGPRGCGKTTLLLRSYDEMLRPGSQVFPVYVNFKTSLKLEPLYKSNVNASYWFSQWLFLKTYQGVHESLSKIDSSIRDLGYSAAHIKAVIADLEAGRVANAEARHEGATVDSLQHDLATAADKTSRVRAVLLLDDAAHAFSFAQQREFFDFFRSVKSRSVSPKAAIYPGVTSFSATFQAGHDAEEVDVWLKPDGLGYLDFMRGFVRKRLPEDIFKNVEASGASFELMCYCAFGIPRALLNMLHELIAENDGRFKVREVNQAVRRSLESTLSVYSSLKLKFPIYEKFIETGSRVLEASAALVKSYNREKPTEKKSVSIAIATPLRLELSRTLGFLEYAGLIAPKGKISRGEKGAFELYGIHYAFLVTRNAIESAKAPSAAGIVNAFTHRDPHEFTRIQATRLVGGSEDDAFSLMLPPCQNCGTARISEDAKFCHVCGAPLQGFSVFEQLVSQDISALQLTETRVKRIKESSRIRTVKDILLDHDFKQLLAVPWIGPYWAARIMSYAEEYIA